VRIAAVQCRPVFDDAEQTIAAIVARLRWADANHVDLVLFPEAWLLGHAYDLGTIQARADGARSALVALCARIAEYDATLVLGTFERVGEQVFNSAVVIEHGRIMGRYAKAHPNEDGVTPGTTFPLYTRSARRYGINICNDANYPQAAASVAAQGAELILYPLHNLLRPETAERWREKSLDNLAARARETGCWIASADVTGTADGRLSYGCTAILSPAGKVVARVQELQEGVALFDLPPPHPHGSP
jgi:predicted amidohydrolase